MRHGSPLIAADWKPGTPPHTGWWVTRLQMPAADPVFAWRWWDGTRWSAPVHATWPIERVADLAATAITPNRAHFVSWCLDWPEGARVGRFNPVSGEMTGKGPQP